VKAESGDQYQEQKEIERNTHRQRINIKTTLLVLTWSEQMYHLTSSLVNLAPKIAQPETNCNTSFLNANKNMDL
jgi:hypothetical protein